MAFTPQRVLNGFDRIRVASADLGPVRTVIAVLEARDCLRLRKAEARKLIEEEARRLAPALQEVSNLPAISDEDIELYASDWTQNIKRIGPKVEVIAIYVINWKNNIFQHWIHREVELNEVVPIVAARLKMVGVAKELREQSVPHQTDLKIPDSVKQDETRRMYVSLPFVKDVHQKPDEVGSVKGRGYETVDMIRNGTAMFTNPVMAPLFIYQCPLLMENQVDHMWENRIKIGDRDPALLEHLFKCIEASKSPTVSMELIKIYESYVGNYVKPPLNWGLSVAMMSLVRSIDVLYGHSLPRAIGFHSRKYGSANFLHQNHQEYSRLGGATDSRRYKLRKLASATVFIQFLNDKVKAQPVVYSKLPEFLRATLDKDDDWADAVAIGVDWLVDSMRSKPYTSADMIGIDTALDIWNDSSLELSKTVRKSPIYSKVPALPKPPPVKRKYVSKKPTATTASTPTSTEGEKSGKIRQTTLKLPEKITGISTPVKPKPKLSPNPTQPNPIPKPKPKPTASSSSTGDKKKKTPNETTITKGKKKSQIESHVIDAYDDDDDILEIPTFPKLDKSSSGSMKLSGSMNNAKKRKIGGSFDLYGTDELLPAPKRSRTDLGYINSEFENFDNPFGAI